MDSHPFLHSVALPVHSNFLCNCSKSSKIFEKLEVKETTKFLNGTRYQLSAEGDFLSHHHFP